MGITISTFPQSLFKGFLISPVTKETLKVEVVSTRPGTKTTTSYLEWLFRPEWGFQGIELSYNPSIKDWNTSEFKAGGPGIGIHHFKIINNSAINDYGFNLFPMFIGGLRNGLDDASVRSIITFHFLKNFDAGTGRNWTTKEWLIYTGVSTNF